MGTTSDFQHGVVPYCVNDIFAKRAALMRSGAQVSVDLSYMEIYLEDCFDLLSKDGERKKLELRETQSGETFLDGLSAWPVMNLAEVAHFLSEAAKVRATGRTAMNAVSSRSHAICTMSIRVFNDDSTLVSKLNLVDLAGSERAKKTQATGEAFQEGVSINKGLLALGNVVAALSNKAKNEKNNNHVHVPYRESRLTRLLKDSLGGNGMTALLACISPANNNFEETLNTLRFASRAACIVNKAEVNHDQVSDAGALLREVNRLREQLLILQEKYDTLSKTSSKRGSTESNEQQVTEDTVIHLGASLKLAGALKSFLMQCIAEDLMVENSLILSIQNELRDIRSSLGYEINGDLAMMPTGFENQSLLLELSIDGLVIDDENMPPIMSTIEELTQLEGHLKSLLRKISSTDSDDGEDDLRDTSAISKDSEVNDYLDSSAIMEVDASFVDPEPTNEELEALGAAPKDIAEKEEKIFSIVAITEQYKATIKELNEEISVLEREREALVANGKGDSSINHDSLKFKQELKLKTKMLEDKIKTLKAKEVEFNKICRVKERLVKELDQVKGKVQEYKRKKVDMMKKMREETFAHQEESKQLKFNELQSKRKVAKAEICLQRVEQKLSNQEKFWKLKLEAKENECNRLRQLMKRQEDNRVIKEKSKPRPMTAFTTNGNAVAVATTSTSSRQLQQLFRDEMRAQQDMAKTQGQLAYEIDARRCLQQEKLDKKSKLKLLRPGTVNHRTLDEQVSALEKEIQMRNKKIGHLQLLGDQPASSQGMVQRMCFLQKDQNFAQADLQACLHKLWGMSFEQMKENHKLSLKLEDMQCSLRTGKVDEVVVDGDREDVLDETFYPSEEDFSDDEGPKRRKRSKDSSTEEKSSKRSRTSIESSGSGSNSFHSENSEGTDEQEVKKPKKPKKVFAEEDIGAIKASKWWTLTIKDLKVELAQRALPVSGVKNDLILRLLNYDQQHASESTEPAESSEPAAEADETMDEEEEAAYAALTMELNDENMPMDMNIVLTPVAEGSGKRLEFGKQLYSPLRALANASMSDKGAAPVLTKDEELQAFRSRFPFNKF